jgi:hypothetical protein
MLQAGGSQIFSIGLILLTALGPGVYSVSNRNEYQKQKRKMFLGVPWALSLGHKLARALN